MRKAVASCASTCLELIVVGSLLLLPAPRALHAQQYGEDLSVRVIQVPVVVWRGTEPVTGLTKDDFEVFVNGVRQPIAYFDVLEFAPDADGEPGTNDSSRELRDRRLTLLLFDTVHSASIQLRRARPAVEQFINDASDDDYFAVAVYTGSSSVHYLVPFTRDRLAILRAVATLERSRSGDALAIGMTADERAMSSKASGLSVTAADVDRAYADDLNEGMRDFEATMDAMNDRAQPPTLTDALDREQSMRDQFAVQSWTAALADAADDLSPLEGTKQVAFFSAGIGLGANRRGVNEISIYTAGERMQKRFHRAGATLNIVDIAGLRAPGGGRTIAGSRHHAPSAFFTAALGTGGRVFHGGGVSTLMRIFSDTTRITYLLGMRPPENEREQNDIRVRVRNQPLFTEVSYRTGYSTAAEDVRDVSGMLLADAMLNDIVFGDVTVALYTDAAAGTVEVGVPSNELLAHAIDGAVSVDFYIYVFDESNDVAGSKHRRMNLNAAEARAKMKGAELVRRERFQLAPGTYTAKALVHITTRDLLGFTRRVFEVPEPVE